MAHTCLCLSVSTLPLCRSSPRLTASPVHVALNAERAWLHLAWEHRWNSKAPCSQNISLNINLLLHCWFGWVIDLSLLPVVFMGSSEDFSHAYCFNYCIQFGIITSNSCEEVMTNCWAAKMNEKQSPISVNGVQMDSGGDNWKHRANMGLDIWIFMIFTWGIWDFVKCSLQNCCAIWKRNCRISTNEILKVEQMDV